MNLLQEFEDWLNEQQLRKDDAAVMLIILDAKAKLEELKKKHNIGSM